jgi:hypothetical protein
MCTIVIRTTGDLGDETVEFVANEYGHAHMINEAIAYLTRVSLVGINADHKSRDAKEEPPKKGWIKNDLSKHRSPGYESARRESAKK